MRPVVWIRLGRPRLGKSGARQPVPLIAEGVFSGRVEDQLDRLGHRGWVESGQQRVDGRGHEDQRQVGVGPVEEPHRLQGGRSARRVRRTSSRPDSHSSAAPAAAATTG